MQPNKTLQPTPSSDLAALFGFPIHRQHFHQSSVVCSGRLSLAFGFKIMFNFFRKKDAPSATPPPLPSESPAEWDQASGAAMIRTILLPMAVRSPNSGLSPFFRALKKQKVIVIASWDSPESTQISLQDFHRGEELFIPMFLDREEFQKELTGTPYENGGKAIDFDFLMKLVSPETLFVLSPSSSTPFDIRPKDYFSAL